MDYTELFTQMTPLLISLLGVLLTYCLVPWLKGKVSEQKIQDAEKWVLIAVKAAEQLFKESKMGDKKKEYVLDILKSKGITITEQELDAMIEAAVYEISKASELLFKAIDMDEIEEM
jgi:hypothetical protein